MGGGGGGKGYSAPSTPAPAPVQEAGVVETGISEAERKKQNEARRRAQTATVGQQSTILTGGLGTNTGSAGTGTILGGGG